MDAIISRELRDGLINHYVDVFRTVLDKTEFEGVDETIQSVKNEIRRCNELQIWYVMFLVVNKLELFTEVSEANTEVLEYEKEWLKSVFNELLFENAE